MREDLTGGVCAGAQRCAHLIDLHPVFRSPDERYRAAVALYKSRWLGLNPGGPHGLFANFAARGM